MALWAIFGLIQDVPFAESLLPIRSNSAACQSSTPPRPAHSIEKLSITSAS